MKAKLLLKLAAKLERLPRKRFHYGSWVGRDWKGRADLSCGTTACALGWATTMPECNLVLRRGSYQNYVATRRSRALKNLVDTGTYSLEAAARAFDISVTDAHYLFLPRENIRLDSDVDSGLSPDATAKQVARHIRAFVKRGGMPKAEAT